MNPTDDTFILPKKNVYNLSAIQSTLGRQNVINKKF